MTFDRSSWRAEADLLVSRPQFFSVKSISEGVESVKALPVEYRGILIRALADAAVDKKADDVNLTRTLFSEVGDKEIVSHKVLLESLAPLVTGLIDLAVDVPSVYTFAVSLALLSLLSSTPLLTLAFPIVFTVEGSCRYTGGGRGASEDHDFGGG